MGILVVDDDEDIREAVIEVLRAEGYETRSAANGQEALEALEGAGEVPELILLDLDDAGHGWLGLPLTGSMNDGTGTRWSRS